MPNHNKSKFLHAALESVLCQTFTRFELIVVDDCSTDSSQSILQHFADKDERVKLIRHPKHLGVAAARNSGIRASNARLITFLDSDDKLVPTDLEKLLRFLDLSPVPSIAYCDWLRIDQDGVALPSHRVLREPKSGMIFPDLLSDASWAYTQIMVPRVCFEEVGLFDESLPWGEDYDMVLSLASKYPFVYTSEPLYVYRIHVGNTENRIQKRLRGRYDAMILEKHLVENASVLDSHTKTQALGNLFYLYSKTGQYGKLVGQGLGSRQGFKLLSRLSARGLKRSIGWLKGHRDSSGN